MGKWLIPESELDRDQKDFINSLNSEVFFNRNIEGFPGSGKTVLLLYAAKHFRQTDPNASILFIEFTHSLIKMMEASLKELTDANNFKEIPVETYFEFIDRDNKSYDYILCDEVQDLPERVLRAIYSRTRKMCVVAGDRNQSIYTEDPKWKEKPCAPENIPTLLKVSSNDKLIILHRLTPTIIKAVESFMPHMDIMSGRRSMMKKDTDIRLWKASDRNQEIKSVAEEAIKWQKAGKSVGILFRFHKGIVGFIRDMLNSLGKDSLDNVEKNKWGNYEYNAINRHLSNVGLPFQYVGNSNNDATFIGSNKITLMTYHGAKGLDFDTVFLPFSRNVQLIGDSTQELEDTLYMVAMTRSRQDLFISYCYSPSERVKKMSKFCKYTDLDDVDTIPFPTSSSDAEEDEFA